MFCYSEKCKGKHDECALVKDLNSLVLDFKNFTNEEEIEMAKDILCLVTSWEEQPYFLVMQRKVRGMVNAFDGSDVENTRILKWAYLPVYQDEETSNE